MGGAGIDIISLVSKLNYSERDLDRQVEEAMGALNKSSELISQLEVTLEGRAAKLQRLKSEYERVSRLSEVTAAQGEAVTKTLENVLGKNQRRERWIAFVISLIAGLIIFVLGVFMSDWIQKLPNLINREEVSIEI
tara:strand:- start:33011 stop:33418 length:408 start_codon:yes stop_codon:yes gene_type:complete